MSSGCYSEPSVRQYGAAKAVGLALLLAGVLLVVTSLLQGCTIQEITLYKTVMEPRPGITPSAKVLAE